MRREPYAPPFTRLLVLTFILGLGCAASESTLPRADPARYLAGQITFPDEIWQRLEDLEGAGWDVEALAAAKARFEELESAALVAVHRGLVVASWGKTDERYTAQSVRKSLVNALIGIEVDSGRLNPAATLGELDIDEDLPLSEEEKSATLGDLLLSRSGVYRSAIYEHGAWKRRKPEPGTHAPGEVWFYNNWGFNVVGSIYQSSSGKNLGEGFAELIAEPLAMQDFRGKDVVVLSRGSATEKMTGNDSRHPAHVFRISTRDLARFGLLYLEEGRWGDRQIVSAEWVRQTFAGIPIEGRTGEEYGFLWWIYTAESPYWPEDLTPVYVAQGNRGHWLAILPNLDLVVAHQVATGGLGLASQARRRVFGSPEVSDAEIGGLIGRIARAAPDG